MNKPQLPASPDNTQFKKHVISLRQTLASRDNYDFTARTGARYFLNQPGETIYQLELMGQSVDLSTADWIVRRSNDGNELSLPNQAMVLFYFITADGSPVASRWVSFSELPDGRFYNQAFQGYTGRELTRVYQNDLESLCNACRYQGGIPLVQSPDEALGDQSFRFQILPRMAVAVAYWLGDEDFPPSAQILFEASAPHYLPTDVCAYLGSTVTRKLISSPK